MAILFVPGFMLDADLWRDVLPGLQDFAPFAFADLGQDETIEAMAARALSAAPPDFVLAGFSMGGYVAREIARQAPRRVRALVLIATSARGDSANLRARRAGAPAGSAAAGLSRTAILRSLHEAHQGRDDLVARIREMGERLGPDAFVRQTHLRREDELHRLGEIDVPTLVIAAADDRLRSVEEAEEMAYFMPKATVTVLDGAGHMLPLETPEALSRTIADWLRDML